MAIALRSSSQFQPDFFPNSVHSHNRFHHGGRLSGSFSCFGVGVPLPSAIPTTIAGGTESTMNALLYSLFCILNQHHEM
jgi:hypothetical protein